MVGMMGLGPLRPHEGSFAGLGEDLQGRKGLVCCYSRQPCAASEVSCMLRLRLASHCFQGWKPAEPLHHLTQGEVFIFSTLLSIFLWHLTRLP